MIRLLCKEDAGFIMACNILDALKANLLSVSILREFIQCCVDRFDPVIHKTTNSVIALFSKTARGYNNKGKLFLLACRHKATPRKDRKMSNTMAYSTFKNSLVDDSDRARRFGYWPPSGSDRAHPAWERLLKGYAKGTCRLTKSKWIGRERQSIFWVLPFDELELISTTSSKEELATSVRDRLGLIHYEKGDSLVAISLSADKLKGRRQARPTFADAGGHRRFKTIPDVSRNRLQKSWGHTADLLKFKAGDPNIDGTMERVIEAISTDDLIEIDYWVLGFVSNTRGLEITDNDAAFATRIMSGRSKNTLIKELMAI
jgi:hypothetical protein